MEHLGIVTVTQVAERPAQIILGLSQLGPEHIRKSAVPTPFALSAALSLHEPYIRSVSGHNPAALLDFLISRIGIVFIVMIGDGVKKIGFTPFFKFFDKGLDPLRISLRQGECRNPGVGDDTAQNLGCADGKVRRLLYGVARSLAVWLVPNAPVDHHALVMFRYCPNPSVPGGKALFGRGEPGVEMASAAALIGGVAVA